MGASSEWLVFKDEFSVPGFRFPEKAKTITRRTQRSHEGDSLLLILWHFGVDAVGPCKDAAEQIVDFGESGGAKYGASFCTAFSGVAMDDVIFVSIEFSDAVTQLPERDEWSAEIADLIFVRFADVKNENIFMSVKAAL